MSQTTLDEIIARLNSTQLELEAELDRILQKQREQFHYRLRRGKVIFERHMHRLQRGQRTSLWRYLRQSPATHIFSSPLIYGMIVPLLFLDITITFYQLTCFRIYGIPLVRRTDHIVIDRHRLAYLNAIESLNCVYCGYSNGLIAYTREIIARTEQYWCPIKHARRSADPHQRSHQFFDYGDVEGWRQGLTKIRTHWTVSSTDMPRTPSKNNDE